MGCGVICVILDVAVFNLYCCGGCIYCIGAVSYVVASVYCIISSSSGVSIGSMIVG